MAEYQHDSSETGGSTWRDWLIFGALFVAFLAAGWVTRSWFGDVGYVVFVVGLMLSLGWFHNRMDARLQRSRAKNEFSDPDKPMPAE